MAFLIVFSFWSKDTVCEDGWYLFEDVCLQLSESPVKFDKISEACSDVGAEPYLNPLLGYWMKVRINPIGLFVYRNIVSCFFQDHSLGVVTSIWGPQKESACMDGSNTEVTCDEEKHVFCSIKGTNLTKKWQTKIQI